MEDSGGHELSGIGTEATAVVDTATIGSFIIDSDGRIVAYDKSWTPSWGLELVDSPDRLRVPARVSDVKVFKVFGEEVLQHLWETRDEKKIEEAKKAQDLEMSLMRGQVKNLRWNSEDMSHERSN